MGLLQSIEVDEVTKYKNSMNELTKATLNKPATKVEPVINYLSQFIEDIEKEKHKKVIRTGFLQLDKKMGGGLFSGLYTLGAISSLGKTTFALQIADHIAKDNDVLFFSLEMSKFELVAKSLSRELFKVAPKKTLNVGTRAIMQGEISGLKEEFTTALGQYEKSAERLTIIEGNFDTDVDAVRKIIESHIKNTGNKPVIFIDYLQILKGQGGNDKQDTDYAVSELKRISRPFFILLQFSYTVPLFFY
jgi:replicative DNA helicase